MISFNQLFKVTKKDETSNETSNEIDEKYFSQVEKQDVFAEVHQEQSTLIRHEPTNENFHEELFKKGDFVKIIYKENSTLNMYKSYNGEIRTYYKGGVTASIQLEACNSAQAIVFPIDHFIKRDFNDPKEKSIGVIKEYFVDGERNVTIHFLNK